jgi:cytochrome c peroxidase
MLRILLSAVFIMPKIGFAQSLPEPLNASNFPTANMAEIELGQLLFWDAELSGNRNISCASCHHPKFGTSDGLSLGMGEGGIGLGPDRRPDPKNHPEQRIPRNAPALWNVGADGFTVLFADGRIEVDPERPNGFRTPLDDEMVTGFASLLSAQTMFPVLSPDEMAGHYSENEISALVRTGRITGPDGAWAAIAARISAIPQYADSFASVYPDIANGRQIDFADISNAIAAYMAFDFRSDGSRFDQYLRNEIQLSEDELSGLNIFYGSANCAACHSGPLFTDMSFHAMGDPQIGPGKAERFESHQRDTGRMRVTNDPADAFAFRTPSLRNVTLTAPYGHSGAFSSLERYLRTHTTHGKSLNSYQISDAVLPAMTVTKPDFAPAPNAADYSKIFNAAQNTKIAGGALQDDQIKSLIAFLKTLEDPIALNGGRMGIPISVPSSLPIEQ